MKNKGLVATIVVLIAVIITLVAVLVLMQMPTILTNDGLAGKIFNPSKQESTIVSTIETTEKKTADIPDTTETLPILSTKIENYTAYKDRVNIDYPQIVGLEDVSLQEKINNKIRTNALSIVPLYPISTAVQNLNISCEVKYLGEDYITIIYEGKVVGVKSRSGSSSSSSSGSSTGSGSKSNKGSSYNDPYLDGFVDPLAAFGQNVPQMNIMPTTSAPISYTTQPTTANVEITRNNNVNNNITPNSSATGTADKGPVAVDIKAPTAPASNRSTYTAENIATNNPTGYSSPIINSNNYSSTGIYYSQSGTQVAPTETSSANSTTYSLPIYGFANTNASDIDQKIYYTNMIDLKTGNDMKLSDFVTDLNALAKYLRSSKVEFANIYDDDRKAVREYVNKTVQSKYVEQMKAADFKNESMTTWPKIFSYRDSDGVVYFSVKLSSKLGNYAIVRYEE